MGSTHLDGGLCMEYSVGLVGFSDHRASLLRLVLGTAPGAQFRVAASTAGLAAADIVIADVGEHPAQADLVELRARSAKAVFVFVSEHGLCGDSRFRLERRSVLVQIRRLLDQVVREEFQSRKVTALEVAKRIGSAAGIVADAQRPPRSDPSTSGNTHAIAPPSLDAPLLALVVDDSAAVRAQVCAGLDRIGLRSHQAGHAEQAMSLVERHWYDLALFDVVMPGVDGYELCRRVKHDARTRRMPVLMLTSRASPFDRARGALVGCDAYLTKPIAWDRFRQAIDAALRKAFQYNPMALQARGYATG